jgi:hypothetical protein
VSVTATRVAAALSLPGDRLTLSTIQGRINECDPDYLVIIDGWLTDYDAAYQTVVLGYGDSSLIRADVLEWSSGGKNQGNQQYLLSLVNRIRLALRLDLGVKGRRTIYGG